MVSGVESTSEIGSLSGPRIGSPSFVAVAPVISAVFDNIARSAAGAIVSVTVTVAISPGANVPLKATMPLAPSAAQV